MDTSTLLSLCSGYGGLDMGLRLAGVRTRALVYVEREISVAKRLVARFADGLLDEAPVWSDLRTFDGRPYRGVDILTAGYPCQPFSCAGKRKGKQDVRHLWPEVARIIKETEAKQVFLENVDAHLRLGGYEVLHELSGMGYRVACGLFTAAETGAPHRRQRLFILAQLDHTVQRGHYERDRRAPSLANRHGAEDGLSGASGSELAQRTSGRRGILRQSPGGYGLTDRRREAVADSEDTDRREREKVVSIATGQRGPGSGSYSPGVFPPGPEELDRWSEVLRRTESLEPSVRRVAHGSTTRVDRLRMLGNGVVPVVAAHAYRTLTADLAAAA